MKESLKLDQRRSDASASASASASAFSASAWALCVVLIGANMPTPLYPIWEVRWGFSTVTLTAIFAAYVVGIILALLIVGRLSDTIGRRRVLLSALALALIAAAMFWFAQSVSWLLAARAVQGLAVGSATGTATAALVDYATEERPDRAPLVGAVSSVFGLSLGPLIAGVIAENTDTPDAAIWLVDFVFVLSGLVFAAMALPRVRAGTHFQFRIQRVGVPYDIRSVFLGCAGVFVCGWVATALFLALGPTFVLSLLHLKSFAIAGAAVFGVFAASAVAQLLSRLLPASATRERTEMAGGLAVLGLGLVSFLLALEHESLVLFVAGTLLVGAGQGVSYRGSLAALQAAAPLTRRGEVMAAYYLSAYVGVAILIPMVGLISPLVGLVTACIVFCVVLAFIGGMSSLIVINLETRCGSIDPAIEVGK
ncbi:MFS transporter [Bradyrhizobium sp. WD16]|uniref:MFS transporter n=1 Tax=Bradyrhizobium sp. WD16 TaxID=1521768 RepID=UPI0020A55264|nr:MFS transporter [Bradyrhizobium sp. WD16]UTD28666.1 hypothetical protein DB459_18980 [Bradyrhizobium sp. WD16]